MMGAPWHQILGTRRWLIAGTVLVALMAGAWWHGWDSRGDREARRIAQLEQARDLATAHLHRAAEAASRRAAEAAALAQEIEALERAHPTADRECLPVDSVRRLNSR